MRAELCRQTVTLYHRSGQTVTRTVLRGVFVQQGRRQKPDVAGAKAGTMLFLVLPAACGTPGTDYTLEPGDRLTEGEGPAVSVQDWPLFVPDARPDVAVVEYVTPYTAGGVLHHLEAGAWWNNQGSGARGLTR